VIRLGITQRVGVIEGYGERRDCLDQAWTTLLEAQHFQPIPLPNLVEDEDAYLDSLALDGVILTSGNDLASLDDPADPAPERDEFEQAVLEYAFAKGLPVLGVCRGLELLTVAFGGSVSPVDGHVAEEHVIIFDTDTVANGRFRLPEKTTVNSYHDFGVQSEDVPEELTVIGRASDGTVESVIHKSHPAVGIMWHPERESPSEALDQQLLNTLFRSDGQ